MGERWGNKIHKTRYKFYCEAKAISIFKETFEPILKEKYADYNLETLCAEVFYGASDEENVTIETIDFYPFLSSYCIPDGVTNIHKRELNLRQPAKILRIDYHEEYVKYVLGNKTCEIS